MTETFGPWQYHTVQADLTIGAPSLDPPEGWESGLLGTEEPLETLLAFNLASLTRLPLRFVNRAGALEAAVDIVATDPIRRIHLFELKKKSVGGQDAAQLEHYLLRHLFEDPDDYLETVASNGWTRTRLDWTARYLCGLYANEAMKITGLKKIRDQLGVDHPMALDVEGRALSKYRWDRLDPFEQLRRLHPAIGSHAAERGIVDYPDLETIFEKGKQWSVRLTPELPETSLTAERRLVLWLVGKSISADALERIRMWRRAGVDARPLRLDFRHLHDRRVIAVRREQAETRDELETKFFDHIRDNPNLVGSVSLDFYDRRAASAGRRHGGDLAADAKITIATADGTTIIQ